VNVLAEPPESVPVAGDELNEPEPKSVESSLDVEKLQA
jgi:hypothetical protein